MKKLIGVAVILAAASPLYGQASPSKPVAPETWFTENDYPAEAAAASAQGPIAAELIVDISGRVNRCMIARSSGSAILDQRTCRILMERGRFTIARNDRGKPTLGNYVWRMKWALPPAPPPTAPGPDMRRQVLRPEFNEVTFLYPAGLNAVVSCQAQQDGKDDKAGVERCESEGRVRYVGLFERAKIRLKMQDHLSGSESFQSFIVTTGKLVIPPLAPREQILAQRISYVDVDGVGNLSNCRFEESGPFIANVLPAHNLCQRVVRVQPFRNASGKPTAGQYVILYRVTAHSFSQAEAKARFPSWPF